MTREARARAVVEGLARAYPDVRCELDHETPFQLLVATVLSAQCTDARVNLVTPELFRAYPDPAAMAAAPEADIERIIHSTGFFRTKARNLRSCAAALVANHGGEVPREMEALRVLPGVGRKTANVVLGTAFGIPEGVVVDTHVARLSARLGLTRQSDPAKIERDLMRVLPREEWILFSHRMIRHGRRRCKALKPDCPGCELRAVCPSAGRVVWKRRPAA